MGEGQNVVLGGGLAGLTAAMTLQEAGEADWTVLERGSKPGGHASSVLRDGYVFDYGPHILFTADPGMEALIRDLLGDNLRSQERRALIFHEGAGGIYTRFPFQAHLHGLPVPLVRECLVELVRAVEARARGEFAPRNYEDWMRGTFGDAIADRLMIPYARKIWTVEPATMDFTWIGRRVPTPDVERIVLGALTDDVEQIGATAQFWYPWRGGIEALPTALAQRVAGVETNREVSRVELGLSHQRFDVEAVAEVRRHAAGAGVRMAEQAHRLELGHGAADGGRRDAQAVSAHERLRADRHRRHDVVLDHDAQDRPLSVGQLERGCDRGVGLGRLWNSGHLPS